MSGPISAAGKPHSARDKACDCLIGILFITVLAVVICITPAVTRLLILIQPKTPDFTLHSSSVANSNWTVSLVVHNPDRNGFRFDRIRASAVLQATNAVVSSVAVAPLEVTGRAKGSVEVVFENVTNGSAVVVRAAVEYRGWTWPVKRDYVEVVCGELKVNGSGCEVSGRWKKMVREWTTLFWDYLYVLAIFLGILLLSF